MDMFKLTRKLVCLLTVMLAALSGCLPSEIPSTHMNIATTGGAGDGALPTSLPPRVEISHLIDPNLSSDPTYSTGTGQAGGGSYVRKLTLPKNFAGRLYVAGINIGTLADRHVKVRFKFGVNKTAITVPATVTEAPGITPSTGINVLVLDLRSEPFRDVALPYDLYDYNEYTATGEPTQNNRDSGLFCRGLKVADDPTFAGTNDCDEAGEECLYSYAKVLDQGLVQLNAGEMVPLAPSLPQVKSTSTLNYYLDYPAKQLLKPLLDRVVVPYSFSDVFAGTGSTNIDLSYVGVQIPDATGPTYFYRGPYRLMYKDEWQYGMTDLTAAKGLFRSAMNIALGSFAEDPTESKIYYRSNLFPLATRLNLNANVAHLSSALWDGARSETALVSAGQTQWMDGSNARAPSKNGDDEHVGSCNVSASIELITRDKNSNEYVVALSKDVKFQLVRPTQVYTDTGDEVLHSNFKTCSSNASCGSSECCFNSRCWNSNLVSQCFDSSNTQGNYSIGDACSSDLQCSSLCCNTSSGLCAPHNTTQSSPVLCNKPYGQFCIAKEWCQTSSITTWLVVRTGSNPLTCSQQAYINDVHGDCINGACVAPVQGTQPVFDPVAPGACTNAVPPPSF